jgi:hypothetical protein
VPRNLSLALFALIAICVVACSSGATATQPPSRPAGTVATQAPPSVALPTSNSGVAGTNICALLPADEVAQITGETISDSVSVNNYLTANDARCQYTIKPTSAGDNNQVVIDVISPGGTEWYDNLASEYASNISPISGIGDKAFQDFTDGSGLVALFGDTAYDVFVDNPDELKSDDQINQVSETLITTLRTKM